MTSREETLEPRQGYTTLVIVHPEMRGSFLPLGARRLSFSDAPTAYPKGTSFGAHPCADGAYAASMPLLRKTTVRRLPTFKSFLDGH
ncbi:MAG: hypothetical protein PVI97_03735 [Candidatus Thiodiazotropha sp.]